MWKMAASHDRMALEIVWKQELLEKQGKLARLWKLQEYYAAANQFEKMSSVMTQIEAMMDSLTQSNDNPGDVIEINSEGSDDDELNQSDSENYNDADLESSGGQESNDNVEEMEEKKGAKMIENAHCSDGENVELTNKQCTEYE